MKTYQAYPSSPDGWNITSVLRLEDDGRFSYDEGRTDYTNVSLSGGATGTWERYPGVIVFRVEKVYRPVLFPWEEGQELRALIQGDTLDFERGWKLRVPVEHTARVPVSNPGTEPLTLVLEPWGIRHTLAPGEKAEVVARGRWADGEPSIQRTEEGLVFHGSNGSWATVVPEPPPPPKPPAPPRAPRTEAAKPVPERVASPRARPPVEPRAPSPPRARFEPRSPSPELAALLRRWVEELVTGDAVNYIARLCHENDAIPLDGNQFEVWALRTDGQVLCIDHESFAQRAEPETDAEVAYGKLEVGARTHPELLELLPPDRGWPS